MVRNVHAMVGEAIARLYGRNIPRRLPNVNANHRDVSTP